MDLGLQGRRAVVTGASKGIGRATAAMLAAEGCDVHLVARSAAELEYAAADIAAASGRRVSFSALDLSVSANVDSLAAEVSGYDILVNNAGLAHVGMLEETTADDYRRMMEVNYFGTVYTTMSFLPHFREQGFGVISAVSSTLGVLGIFGYSLKRENVNFITAFQRMRRKKSGRDFLPLKGRRTKKK